MPGSVVLELGVNVRMRSSETVVYAWQFSSYSCIQKSVTLYFVRVFCHCLWYVHYKCIWWKSSSCKFCIRWVLSIDVDTIHAQAGDMQECSVIVNMSTTARCLTSWETNTNCVNVTDFARLFRVLDGLEGSTDECCACITTVIREAERFKRQSLAQKLRDFRQRRLSQPTRRPSTTVPTCAASDASLSSSSPLSRTSHSTASAALNCNHTLEAV